MLYILKRLDELYRTLGECFRHPEAQPDTECQAGVPAPQLPAENWKARNWQVSSWDAYIYHPEPNGEVAAPVEAEQQEAQAQPLATKPAKKQDKDKRPAWQKLIFEAASGPRPTRRSTSPGRRAKRETRRFRHRGSGGAGPRETGDEPGRLDPPDRVDRAMRSGRRHGNRLQHLRSWCKPRRATTTGSRPSVRAGAPLPP
jgi:hypothetical protein